MPETKRPSSTAEHRHEWVACKPGTVGADAASYCSCGLYSVPDPTPDSSMQFIAARARTLRLLAEQGWQEIAYEPVDKDGAEHG